MSEIDDSEDAVNAMIDAALRGMFAVAALLAIGVGALVTAVIWLVS